VLFGPIVSDLFQSVMVHNPTNNINLVLIVILDFLFGISGQINKILEFKSLGDILLKNVDAPFESIILLVHESLSDF
jgi:hypothetical protein